MGLPEVAGGEVAQRGAGGTLIGSVASEENDGFPGMAGGKAIDARHSPPLSSGPDPLSNRFR